MTKNQIAFWDLAWKQHYQNVELSLRSYELALQAEKQKLEWAKLNEQVRAALVAEALNERKQILAEYQAELQIHHTSAQIQKMLTETNVMKQQMYLSLIQTGNEEYMKYTKQMAEIYAKVANVKLSLGIGGSKAGVGTQMEISGSQYYLEMKQLADDLGAKRRELENIYANLENFYRDYNDYDKYEKQSYIPKIKQAKDSLRDDLDKVEEHWSSNSNVKQSSKTIGPGIGLDNKSSEPSNTSNGKTYSNKPETRESSGPGSSQNNSATGTKIISNNNIGPGVGRGSTSNSGKSSNVIVSPGVKISSGPGY